MNRILIAHLVAVLMWGGMLSGMTPAGVANAKGVSQGHSTTTGVVITHAGGMLKVRTPTGNLVLSEKAARQHGHAVPRIGDEVTIVFDENNTIIEAHPKGEEGRHHFYTGGLAYMGKMKKAIKIVTSEGEKIFPLGRLEVKTKPIEEGAAVTVEVNESGTVIDLHRADDHVPNP